MSYLAIWNLRENGILLAKTSVAIMKAAEDILNEDAGTSNHANRIIWANASLLDPFAMAKKMIYAILQNAVIQSSGEDSTDSDVQFVVNSLVDRFAKG